MIASCLGGGCGGLALGPRASDRGCDEVPGGPGALVGLDADSGEKIWDTEVGLAAGAASFAETVVVRSPEGNLRGIDRRSGDIRWCVDSVPATGREWIGAVRAGDRVVVLDHDAVVAFDPDSGTEVWRQETDPIPTATGERSPQSTIAPSGIGLVGGAAVWVVDQDAEGTVVEALDPEDGTPVRPMPFPPPALPFGDRAAVDDLYLSASSAYVPGRQEIEIAPIDATTGVARWAETVPGFVAALVPSGDRPIVVVIDQTGGTGDTARMVDSRVTAYDSATADLLWQEALPGTPFVIAATGPDTFVVPTGSELVAFDSRSGARRWTVDHGSPGRGGRYSQPGSYTFFSSDGAPIVGLITASEPYRD